jgi:hypothetical protein
METFKPTLRVMVLNSQDAATSSLGIGNDSLCVNRLDGEKIYHSDWHFHLGQAISSLQSLGKGHTASNHSHLIIVALADNLKDKI